MEKKKELIAIQNKQQILIRFQQGFFWGGGLPPFGKNFANPPIRHLSPFLDQGLSPPPPEPRLVPENLKNSNTFLCQIWLLLSSKVPYKAVFHALNSQKWPNFALGGQFWLQTDFFCKVPPPIRLRPHRGPTGTKNFEKKTPDLLGLLWQLSTTQDINKLIQKNDKDYKFTSIVKWSSLFFAGNYNVYYIQFACKHVGNALSQH